LAVRKSLYDTIAPLSCGETIDKSLSQSPYITTGFLDKISICRQAGRLDEAFRDIAKKAGETSKQRMEIVYRTLFRIQAFATGMSIAGTIYIICGILGSSHKWYN
jgi:type II secretory pathway component PulF